LKTINSIFKRYYSSARCKIVARPELSFLPVMSLSYAGINVPSAGYNMKDLSEGPWMIYGRKNCSCRKPWYRVVKLFKQRSRFGEQSCIDF
jgi:hypothetical protein